MQQPTDGLSERKTHQKNYRRIKSYPNTIILSIKDKIAKVSELPQYTIVFNHLQPIDNNYEGDNIHHRFV